MRPILQSKSDLGDVRVDNLPCMGGLDESPRGKILRVAAYLFQQQGYTRTTVRDIATLVGIQSGSLFHHFKTKDEILLAIMYEAICYNTARLEHAIAQHTQVLEKIKALILAELQSINGDTGSAMAVLVFEWQTLTTAQQAPLLSMRDYYENIWLDVLAKAQAEGVIQHAPFIWRRLVGGAIAWTVTWYKPSGSMSLDQLSEVLLQMGAGGTLSQRVH